MGCEGINAAVRKDLLSVPVPLEQIPMLFSASETGPLWYRGLANEPEAALAPRLDVILERMRARAIVIGHTTVLPGKITPRLGGRVIQIDTGMVNGEFYPGGVASALELQGDKATAIYLDRREPLGCAAVGAAVLPRRAESLRRKPRDDRSESGDFRLRAPLSRASPPSKMRTGPTGSPSRAIRSS